MPAFVFSGLPPYVRAAAVRNGKDLADPNTLRFLGQSQAAWHAKQIGQGLSTIADLVAGEKAGRIEPGSATSALENIAGIRDSIAILLEAVDAAIAEVTAQTILAAEASGDAEVTTESTLVAEASGEAAKPARRVR